MNRAHLLGLSIPILLLGSVPMQAQFGLDKIKKAVDTAEDVADVVDDFTFSEGEEIELGLAISQRIRSRYGVAQDPEVTRYMSLVGQAVAARSGRASLPWQWIVLDSDVVNAFATPGGYIHVTRGALAVIDSEAELAGVLAHEAAHVTRKHTIKALQKNYGKELAESRAGLTIGSALFNALADQAYKAVLAGFSQEEELEADAVAIDIVSRVGYGAAGLTNFLGTLNGFDSSTGVTSALYRSHPETRERIKKLDRSIRKRGFTGGVWQVERYARQITYDVSADSTGAGADAGARGIAGESETAESDTAEDESTDEEESRFSLATLSNPFEMGDEEESSEVTGAGAGRAVGEEEGAVEAGAKNTEILDIEISQADLEAFLEEGGLQ